MTSPRSIWELMTAHRDKRSLVTRQGTNRPGNETTGYRQMYQDVNIGKSFCSVTNRKYLLCSFFNSSNFSEKTPKSKKIF